MVTFGEKAMIWNRNKEGFGIVRNVLHHEYFTGYMVAVTSYKFIAHLRTVYFYYMQIIFNINVYKK